MTTTLLQLRDRCKYESDNVGQSFVSDTEWNTYIQASYQELYGLIVEAFGNDYFTQSPASGYTWTTDGINQFFALPTDFYKLLGVDLQISAPNYWVSLKPFAFQERNKLSVTNTLIPMAGQNLRMFYVPRCPTLAADGDVVDGVNGWEEYIIVDACIKALAKEESDVSVFAARKQGLVQRIQNETEARDAGASGLVADVQGRRARAMQYRINGNQIWLIGNGMPGYGPYGDWGNDTAYGWY
jgi:hypothetical protein